mmetsp:Transcript_27718/g.51567  ORF Transcript_27718/g.51567 Transcript_27718/m.51567 type:complete len:345 (-) Transcript_27718:3071-4105(-)
MTEMVRLTLSEATSLLIAVFERAGARPSVASCVSRALVAAESEGQVGHGFSRVADYVAQIHSGKINVEAKPKVEQRAPAALHIKAENGFAYPALEAALEAGIPLAQEMGVSVMTIGNSHHCGAMSVQVEQIANAGLIGLMVANAPKAIAPWGAKDPVFGTNPIAFATPVANSLPLVIDLSLSIVARGKVMAAHKAGKPIPEGWALDIQGQSTTDAGAALEGTMLPIGEAKGTALALMVEILAAALSGSSFSRDAGSFFTSDGDFPNVGQTLIAIHPSNDTEFGQRVAGLLETISSLEGARLPGARRRLAILLAERHGLKVPMHLYQQVHQLAGMPTQPICVTEC